MIARLQARGHASNVPLLLHATGTLRPDMLREALQRMVDQHEVLNSVFTGDADALVQTPVAGAVIGPLAITDLSQSADPLAAALDEVAAGARRPYDPAEPLRLRARLFRLGADQHLVSLMIDHMAADGASLGIVADHWRRHYRALVTGVPCDIPTSPPQYRDYALWQHAWLQSDEAEELRAAWIADLEGLETGPLTRNAVRDAELHAFDIDAESARRLSAICSEHRLKPFVVMLACYAALLTIATGEYDLVISTVRANRSRPDTRGIVGHFANLLPLRVRLRRDWGVDRLLAVVGAATKGAYAREALPFLDVAEAVWHARGILASRLAELAINFVPFPDEPGIWSDDLQMEQLWRHFGGKPSLTGRVTLFMRYQSSGIGGVLVYDPQRIDRAWIERFPKMLATILERLARGSSMTVAELLSGFA